VSSALFILAPAVAQEIRILNTKATTLGTIDSPPGYQTVMLIAEVPPNTRGGRLTHPGIETSYILERDFTLKADGQPDKLLKAGDPFQVATSVAATLEKKPQCRPRIISTFERRQMRDGGGFFDQRPTGRLPQ
jgi:hypothetical protein